MRPAFFSIDKRSFGRYNIFATKWSQNISGGNYGKGNEGQNFG